MSDAKQDLVGVTISGFNGRAFFASVLLERNRWTPDKIPSFRVSEWMPRIQSAGFDGMELWEHHAFLADEAELSAIGRAADILPVTVFSSYASLDDRGTEARERVADICRRFSIPAVKFNFGPDQSRRREYLQAAAAWADLLPPETILLCECHAGTIAENPSDAAALLTELAPARFGAIVHPFSSPIELLQDAFSHMGLRIAHAHLQLRSSANVLRQLQDDPGRVADALKIMSAHGYNGTYSFEFTAGTGEPNETLEAQFQAAHDDLRFFRRFVGEAHAAKMPRAAKQDFELLTESSENSSFPRQFR